MWPFDINLVLLADRRTLTECVPAPQTAIKVWWLCNLCLEKALGRGRKKRDKKTENIDRSSSPSQGEDKAEEKVHCQAAQVASQPCWGAAQSSRLWFQWNLHSITFAFYTVVTWSGILIGGHSDLTIDQWSHPDMTFSDVHIRCFNRSKYNCLIKTPIKVVPCSHFQLKLPHLVLDLNHIRTDELQRRWHDVLLPIVGAL